MPTQQRATPAFASSERHFGAGLTLGPICHASRQIARSREIRACLPSQRVQHWLTVEAIGVPRAPRRHEIARCGWSLPPADSDLFEGLRMTGRAFALALLSCSALLLARPDAIAGPSIVVDASS